MLLLAEDSDGISICITLFLLGDRRDGISLWFTALSGSYGGQAIQSKIQTCSCADERHSGGSWIPA
jgi:hypothetical protein